MILHMDLDDALRRYPDGGRLCKWLTGSHYWDAWRHARDKVDLSTVHGRHVGYYAKIRETPTLDLDELEQTISANTAVLAKT